MRPESWPLRHRRHNEKGCLVGIEVLALWQHLQRGLLSRAAVVEVAELAGLIETLYANAAEGLPSASIVKPPISNGIAQLIAGWCK